MNSILQDRVYFITGASKGIGLAMATALIQQGAKVALVARSEEPLQQATKQLRSRGGDTCAAYFCADMAQPTQIRAAMQAAHQHFGRLDGVINNAGVALPSPVETLQDEAVASQVAINFVGLVHCCQAAIPLLRQSDNARIVNITSATVRHRSEMAHMSIYAATKAAVDRFTQELREEVKADGIAVTALSPGSTASDFGSAWSMDDLAPALAAWQSTGPQFDGVMAAELVAEALIHCLSFPAGVAVDLLEVRPNQPMDKPMLG